MAGMLKRVAPLSYEAWIDYDVCGVRMSRLELDAVRRLVSVEDSALVAGNEQRVDQATLDASGLNRREVRELFEKLAPRAVPDFELDLAQGQAPEYFAERFAEAVPKVDKAPEE
jgi:hypothetical protein